MGMQLQLTWFTIYRVQGSEIPKVRKHTALLIASDNTGTFMLFMAS